MKTILKLTPWLYTIGKWFFHTVAFTLIVLWITMYSTHQILIYFILIYSVSLTELVCILCLQCQHPLSMVFVSSRCMKSTNLYMYILIIKYNSTLKTGVQNLRDPKSPLE